MMEKTYFGFTENQLSSVSLCAKVASFFIGIMPMIILFVILLTSESIMMLIRPDLSSDQGVVCFWFWLLVSFSLLFFVIGALFNAVKKKLSSN